VLYDPALDDHVAETQQMNDLVAAFMAATPMELTPETIANLRGHNALAAQEPLDFAEVRTIDGPHGPIDLRILRPDSVDGVYLEIHGGGWAIGAADHSDAANWNLAQAASVATVGVEYRLAPECPFPMGPDDCLAAARWLVEHAADEFGTDRLVIGGGSAGAHLAALTLVRLRDEDDAARAFRGANLVFGCYDLGMTPTQRTSHDALVIPYTILEQFFDYCLPGLDADQRRDPQHSPLYADLTGLPPALFTVGTLDPLLDDSLFMAARWRAADNEAHLAVYPESIHGFVAFPTELARRAVADITRFVDERIHAD
jgi:acetyl esterase/lipase